MDLLFQPISYLLYLLGIIYTRHCAIGAAAELDFTLPATVQLSQRVNGAGHCLENSQLSTGRVDDNVAFHSFTDTSKYMC